METLTATKWAIDAAHSEIAFSVKHMMISTVRGHFESFEGSIHSESDDFTGADVEFSLVVDSSFCSHLFFALASDHTCLFLQPLITPACPHCSLCSHLSRERYDKLNFSSARLCIPIHML